MSEIDRSEIMEELKRFVDKVDGLKVGGRVEDVEFTEDISIVRDLGLHSIDLLDLTFDVETHWDLTILDDEYKELQSVGDLVDLIIGKLRSKVASSS